MQQRAVVLIGVVSLFAMPFAPATAQGRSSPIDGVWEYINPGEHGQSFFFNGHYVHFAMRGPAQSLPAGALSDSVRASLWSSLLLNGGTFEVQDTLVTAHSQYSKDPRAQPATWHWSFTMKGDTLIYRVLNAAGQATSGGRAVRVRP